jgi:hypothetical protein
MKVCACLMFSTAALPFLGARAPFLVPVAGFGPVGQNVGVAFKMACLFPAMVA